MSILAKIKQLRNKGIFSDDIEILLLNGKLGEIYPNSDGYLYIENFLLSWLIIEAHRPGFVEWMKKHPGEYVVHHIDGNILNNIYTNLQIMSRSEHTSKHLHDPKFAEAEKARCESISESLKAYRKDPANANDIEAVSKAMSKTKRNGWIIPENNPEFFEKLFTVKDYADISKIDYAVAWYRLTILSKEGQITCEKKWIDRYWCNVYMKT